MQKNVSIIIPVFNEEQNLPILYQELKTVLTLVPTMRYEIIFINDGSKDNSWQLIATLAHNDKTIKGINLTRNFGHQAALIAGYAYATGNAIISMDADLQHPPNIIPQLIEKWLEGTPIVYARKLTRKEPWSKRITALWYYKCMSYIANVTMPRNVADFRLIDKKVLTSVKQCKEHAPYLRGIIAWTGFNHAFVDFDQPSRIHGTAGYTWPKMIKLAFDGITSFSLLPLRCAAFMGVFVITTGSLLLLYIAYDSLAHRIYYQLFKWLVTVIYIFIGIQFLLLWIIGEYIGRIFEEQKERPLYTIEKTVNIKKKKKES